MDSIGADYENVADPVTLTVPGLKRPVEFHPVSLGPLGMTYL